MDSTGAAIGKWTYWIMGYNVILSCIIGFAAGYVARKLLKLSVQQRFIDKESILVFSVALAVSKFNLNVIIYTNMVVFL
ncbi:MAG: hypothetical protein JSY10_16960 [Paenibacillus sp.]|nr:hypothetical protein [Paenibacillus sp.]